MYIIVVIAHDFELTLTFAKLHDAGLMGFPYYYLGVDAWFHTSSIPFFHLQNYTMGFIGKYIEYLFICINLYINCT